MLSPHSECFPATPAHEPTSSQPVDFEGDVNLFHFVLLRCVGKGAFGKVRSSPPRRSPPTPPQVRMVQHKQTRELYALKYINKSKCVKMKAVANIVQERRLLEEVRSSVSPTISLISLCRSTIPLSSTSDMRSRTTTTVSLSSISCSAVICAVRPLPFSPLLPSPSHSPSRPARLPARSHRPILRRRAVLCPRLSP